MFGLHLMKFQNDKGLKLIKESKSLSPGEIRTLVKNATPEARWSRHSVWMKANQNHLDESVFNKLDEVRELLDEAPQNSRLILALLKILDEFKARFDLQPIAFHGKKFTARKVDSIGPIRKFIRAQLTKSPALTNAQLWAAMSKKPLKGWQVFDNHLGKYLEGPAKANGDIQNVNYRRFTNIAATERRLLKG